MLWDNVARLKKDFPQTENKASSLEGFSRTCALTQPSAIYILLIQFYGSMSVLIRKSIGNNTVLRSGSCDGMLCCCFLALIQLTVGREKCFVLHCCCWRNEGRNQFSCSCVWAIFIDFNSPTCSLLLCRSLYTNSSLLLCVDNEIFTEIKYTQFYRRCCINLYIHWVTWLQVNPHNYTGNFLTQRERTGSRFSVKATMKF